MKHATSNLFQTFFNSEVENIFPKAIKCIRRDLRNSKGKKLKRRKYEIALHYICGDGKLHIMMNFVDPKYPDCNLISTWDPVNQVWSPYWLA